MLCCLSHQVPCHIHPGMAASCACSLGIRIHSAEACLRQLKSKSLAGLHNLFLMSGACCRQSHINRSCRRCSKRLMPKQHNEDPLGLGLGPCGRQRPKQQVKNSSGR